MHFKLKISETADLKSSILSWAEENDLNYKAEHSKLRVTSNSKNF